MSHTCKICNKEEKNFYYEQLKKKLLQERLCFSCNFWLEIINDKEDYIIIANHSYQICHNGQTKPSLKGFGVGGRTFCIKQGENITITSNLWHQGEIPERFRTQLPNNAEFVKAEYSS